MKYSLILLLSFAFSFLACEQKSDTPHPTDAYTEIAPEALPIQATQYLRTNHAPARIVLVEQSARDFRVHLDTDQLVRFDLRGQHLDTREHGDEEHDRHEQDCDEDDEDDDDTHSDGN